MRIHLIPKRAANLFALLTTTLPRYTFLLIIIPCINHVGNKILRLITKGMEPKSCLATNLKTGNVAGIKRNKYFPTMHNQFADPSGESVLQWLVIFHRLTKILSMVSHPL